MCYYVKINEIKEIMKSARDYDERARYGDSTISSSVYLFGQDTKDEYSAEVLGVGDTLIVRVSSAQLGNVGGLKFAKWYGFSGRVEWCACFVSWCANQCGYIDKGIIPKFAAVGDGADWFKAKGRFQNNKYMPHPGAIIFFDWGADGTRDHVGIVERCDGKMVYRSILRHRVARKWIKQTT